MFFDDDAVIAHLLEPETAQYQPLWRPLVEAEVQALAAGQVPDWIRETCRELLEWRLQTGSVSFVGLAQQRKQRAMRTVTRRKVKA